VLAKLNVGCGKSSGDLKNKYQFMLASIEGTHSAIVFYPDTYVFSSCQHFAGKTPIHADEIDCTGVAKTQMSFWQQVTLRDFRRSPAIT
jgi:hypothetical protein